MILVPLDETETEETLDFNRVTPMPAILKDIVAGSDTRLGVEILTGIPKPDLWGQSCLTIPWVQELGIKTLSDLREWVEKERPRALEEGRKAIEAYHQTGFYDWYDWRVENWGSKWNSYAFGIDQEADERLSFHFDTAWSFPLPVLEKLAGMFPALCFECVCFDEGWNFAGVGMFNGSPPFKLVDATDDLFEAVYGSAPEYDDEPSEPAPVMH
jgi:hypothetical protein